MLLLLLLLVFLLLMFFYQCSSAVVAVSDAFLVFCCIVSHGIVLHCTVFYCIFCIALCCNVF